MPLFTVLNIIVILTVCVTSEECPCSYSRYSPTHSYCAPPNPACNILIAGVNANDIQVILREHNQYRSDIAMGKINDMPVAANMLQMFWDDELAGVAQQYAKQCLFEHDCPNCRRVPNFGVGQNLAIEEVSNSPTIPEPNWPSAIKSWYDEILYFSQDYIQPFVAAPHPSEHTYGHFSQLLWAKSWRIGCGFTLYQEGNTYKKLYVCNYGSAGNIVEKSMYKQADSPCSACPENSCCGEACGEMFEYPGLCKITDNMAPRFKPEGNYIFYCDFYNQDDCQGVATGQNNWLIHNTLSGSHMGIVLNGGEESTMTFNNLVKPVKSSFCFVTSYRKGPNAASQENANTATEIFTIVGKNYEIKQDLPNFSSDLMQQFSEFSMGLNWDLPTEIKLKFSVPVGKPKQFLEIQSIYAVEGPCP